MSNKKITDFTVDTTPASGDLVETVDISDTTDNASGSSKKVTAANFITKGHGLSDSTIVGVASGVLTSGTDVAVVDGGTGSSTASGARTNLGLGTGDSPQFTSIELGGAATDTTLTRAAAGDINVEGNRVYRAGGTDVAIADGGTGQSTKAAGFDGLSPMSASGDVIYGGASGTGTRLAKGSDGQVLTLASGVPSWAAAAGGSSVRYKFDLYAGIPDSSATFPQTGQVTQGVNGTAATIGVNGSGRGFSLSSGSTNTGVAWMYYHQGTTSNNITKIFDNSPRCFFQMGNLSDASDHKWFMGIGATYSSSPSDNGAARKIVGFRHVRASAASTIYAVVGDGSSETATDVTSAATTEGWVANDQNKSMLWWFDMTSGTNVKFYLNKTLLATISTNMPSGDPTTVNMGMGVYVYNNSAGTVSNTLQVKQAYGEVVVA